MDPEGTFRDVVGDLDRPMIIVTAAAAGERSGCLVGFHAQGSIDPPRYVVWLSKANHTFGVAMHARTLVVHVLSTADRALAELFGSESGDEIDKFTRCGWSEGPEGVPVLDGVARWFAGAVLDRVDTGDHVAHVLAPLAGEARAWSGQLGLKALSDLEPGHSA